MNATSDPTRDTIDRIKTDIFQFIRKLEKQDAELSVYLLVDSFLTIAKHFSLNLSEYEYYLEKYKHATRTENDLSKQKIIQFLKRIISRLEEITQKTFNPDLLFHTQGSTESLEIQKNKPSHIENEKKIISNEKHSSNFKGKRLVPPKSVNLDRIEEQLQEEEAKLRKKLEKYPDLQKTLDAISEEKDTMTSMAKFVPPNQNSPEKIHLTDLKSRFTRSKKSSDIQTRTQVYPLVAFGYENKIPQLEYSAANPWKTEKNEKK